MKKRRTWTYSVGEAPLLLTAFERSERGKIYTRVWDGQKYSDRRPLCDPIRDQRGKIVPALETRAQQLCIDRHRALAAGVESRPTGPLTLAIGLGRVLHAKEGKYAADTGWKDDVERYAKIIREVLGETPLMSELRHAHYRKLWRHLAEQHKKNGKYGPRAAEMIVGTLRSAVAWLQSEELLEPGVGLPAENWKRTLKTEWAEITGKPVQKPKKPRHTTAEQKKLWEAMPKADPRCALLVEIGAELRLGQVARTLRSQVHSHGGFRIGLVEVIGRGKKHGAPVALTMQQRHALTRAMTSGYLSDVEAAFRAGTLKDYLLFAGGRFRKGKAQTKNAMTPIGKTGLKGWWRELERVAGVKYIRGRGAYGIRRLHSDLAEDVTDDARVLNQIGGWTNTKTREGYQQDGRPEIANAARVVRQRIRPELPQKVNPSPKSGVTVESK